MKSFVSPVPRTNTVFSRLRHTTVLSLLLIGTSVAWGISTASANQVEAEAEAEGEADKVVEYSPVPKRLAIGENRKWTYWNALMPGQQVTLQFKEPAEVTLSARKMLYPQDSGKDQPVAIHLQEGGKTREIRLKAEETNAVVNKSDAKPGPAEVSTHQVAAGTRWTLTGPAGRAPAAFLVETSPVAKVTAPPSFVATDAAGEDAGRDEEIKRWFIGPSIGYLYGIGDVSSLHAELDAGYRLPWLDNALAVKVSGGWYASSKIEQESDPMIGDFENEWHLRAIPISLNVEYWIPIKRFTAFGGLGFEYTLAKFRFESRNALGIISPEDVTDGSAMGTRFYGGARFTAGPGDIVGALQFSSSNINNDFSEYTGDLGGLSILVGYQFTF